MKFNIGVLSTGEKKSTFEEPEEFWSSRGFSLLELLLFFPMMGACHTEDFKCFHWCSVVAHF